MFLKNIDSLIRQGNLPAALQAILEAKELHPHSPYPKIYEERVRALMAAKQNPQETRVRTEGAPAEVTPPLPSTDGNDADTLQGPRQTVPLPEARAEVAPIDQPHHHDPRQQALMAKVASIIARAREYEVKKEYVLAIQEVSRAALLDPASRELQLYEQELRTKQEAATAQQDHQNRLLTADSDLHIDEAVAQIQQDLDEKQREEEEQRRAAQRQKVDWYIKRLTELIATERFEEAQNQLAFAQVLDPSNERLIELARNIRSRVEEDRAKRLEWVRKKEEEKQRVAEALDAAIYTHVQLAKELAHQGNFEEALRVVTRAYTLNPEYPDILACEDMIIAKQDEKHRADQEKRQKDEEQFRRLQSEARVMREQAERERLLQEKREQSEQRRHDEEQAILRHLARAKNFLGDGLFEQAFAEIALAFMINPFDRDIKIMEEEVHRAQQEYAESLSPPTVEDDPGNLHQRVDAHIKDAIRFRSDREYAKALDEIASAFLLDPLNDAIKNLEKEIHTEYIRYEEEQRARRDSEDAKSAVRERLMMAQHHFDCGKFQEALAEVARGLKIDPENEEAQALRAKIAAARLRQKEAERSRQRLSSMLAHIVKAKQHLAMDEFEQALAEVNQGLSYETTHADLLNLKWEIEQAEQKWREEKERKRKTSEIQQHIRRAEQLITIRAFDEALVEISLGLTRSPGTEELKQLEHKVWQLRSANGHNDQPAREEPPHEAGPDLQSAAG